MEKTKKHWWSQLYTEDWIIVFAAAIILVLAIPCAMGVYISPRILAWEEEPKQYHLSVLVRKVI